MSEVGHDGTTFTQPAGVLQPFNFTPTQQPLVSLLHTSREMKIFGVTENELRTLTLVNAAIAALFSLGTGAAVYLLNISTDATFAGKLPESTTNLLHIIRVGLVVFCAAFYLLGIYTWVIRGSFIETIKTESDPALRQHARQSGQPGKWKRILAALRS